MTVTAPKRDPRDFAAADTDFAALRVVMVPGIDNACSPGERRNLVFGGRRPAFFDHANALRSEFVGRSELLALHAAFVAALRRRLALDHFLPLYLRLWREESAFLLRELSLRWLVSACDTLVDHGESPAQKAVALNGSVLANLAKLSETERRLAPPGEARPVRGAGPRDLFDEMTPFRPGGDMIDNLFRRIDGVAALDPVAGPILVEISRRVRALDTVVNRLGGG